MRYFFLLLFSLSLLFSCGGKEGSADTRLPLFETVADAGVDFSNQLQPTEEFNIISYLYYYNGGGVAVADINQDGRPDLYFTRNQGPNELYLNRGNWQFEAAADRLGAVGRGQWTTGVSITDATGDGLPDIYVCNVSGYRGLSGGNELFVQQPDGTFREQAADYGLDFSGFSTQAYWFDYDLDGDLDVYLLNHSVHGDATYGRADFREQPDAAAGDRLYRRDTDAAGRTRYINMTAAAGVYSSKIGYGLSAAIADFDGDGYPDIYVCNDFSENDYYYHNRGDGTFSEEIAERFGHTSNFSMGSDVGDLDNDGRPDLLTLDMQPGDEVTLKSTVSAEPYNAYRIKRSFGYYDQLPRNNLQWNRGDGRFSEIAELAGLAATDWSWSALLADFDLDGRQDVFISNGILRRPNDLNYLKFIHNETAAGLTDLELAQRMPSGAVANAAYRNEGNWTFTDQAAAWGLGLVGSSTGAAYGDLDGDGDLDLVLNNLNTPATLYRNTTLAPADSVLRGPVAGRKQEVKVPGARHCLRLPVTGRQDGAMTNDKVRETRWIAEVDCRQRGFLSQSASPPLLCVADSLADRISLRPAPVEAADLPPFTLVELPPTAGGEEPVPYSDFDAEPLQPRFWTDGPPAAAVTAAEGGMLLYVGNTVAAPARLLFWNGAEFREEPLPPALAADSLSPAAAALFLDVDGDGDQDLYVASGSGRTGTPPELLGDRLYLQDRTGWQRCVACLPQNAAHAACVVAGDFDADGDQDIFVGGRGVPGSYGLPGRSLLWINDGTGRYAAAPELWTKDLLEMGMVTAAAWLPGRGELAVVGEWMPLTLLHPGRPWTKTEVPATAGWWNSLTAADPDNDGLPELLAGNFGRNSSLRVSPTAPARLYPYDWDGNGKTDPLLTHVRNGNEVPYYDKDEIAAQLPAWKRNRLDYRDFAGQSFAILFPKAEEFPPPLRLETLATTVFKLGVDGKWAGAALPAAAQVTSVRAMLALADGGFLLGGNELRVQPRLGRQDGASLQWLDAAGRARLLGGDRRPVGRLIDLGGGKVLVVR